MKHRLVYRQPKNNLLKIRTCTRMSKSTITWLAAPFVRTTRQSQIEYGNIAYWSHLSPYNRNASQDVQTHLNFEAWEMTTKPIFRCFENIKYITHALRTCYELFCKTIPLQSWVISFCPLLITSVAKVYPRVDTLFQTPRTETEGLLDTFRKSLEMTRLRQAHWWNMSSFKWYQSVQYSSLTNLLKSDLV